jgi:phage tail-like protein
MSSYYPPTSFHFKVEFLGVDGMSSDAEHRFQEVSGLSFEVQTEELREGGENRFTYKLPKRTQYPNLVLKRGLLSGTAILDWFNAALRTYYTVALYDFKPADMMITLLNESSEPAAIWNVVQAYPLKWAVSEFRSTDNTVAVETIELAYQYFERKL